MVTSTNSNRALPSEISVDMHVRLTDDRKVFLLRGDVDIALKLDAAYPDGFSFTVVNESKSGSIVVAPSDGVSMHIGSVGFGKCGQPVRLGDLATHTWRKSGSLWFSSGGYSTNVRFDQRSIPDARSAAPG